MKTTLTLLYSCDAHHTQTSKFLHGVFSSHGEALDAIARLISVAKAPALSVDDLRNLAYINQTQGYAGEGEFMLVDVTLDEIDVGL